MCGTIDPGSCIRWALGFGIKIGYDTYILNISHHGWYWSMPCPMLYWLRLHGYTPYAHELRSGLTEWIIWWIAHKRKSANLLSFSKQWIHFSYHSLPIIQAYNVGTFWLRSHITTSIVDSDSGHAAWLDRYIVPHPSAATLPAWLDSDIVPWPSHLGSDIAPRPRSPRQRCHQQDSTAPSPAWLDCTVVSMTRYLHRAMAKMPWQRHHQHDSVEPSPAWLHIHIAPRPSHHDSTVASMTR
jgi:hypothetical protein